MKSKRLKACPNCTTYVKLQREELGARKVLMFCPKCEFEYEYMEKPRFKKVYAEEV